MYASFIFSAQISFGTSQYGVDCNGAATAVTGQGQIGNTNDGICVGLLTCLHVQ